MRLRIGILLSGCGAIDGTDPQEAVLFQLAVQKAGHEPVCLALDAPQYHVSDHTTTQEISGENRNQFQESQRLVRGKLHLVSELSPKILDALIIPGGQGPLKSWLQTTGPLEPPVLPEALSTFLRDFRSSGGVLGVSSLSEFIASTLEGPWPEGKGCLDLAPDEVLEDAEKGRVLSPGNLSAADLPQLQRGVDALVGSVIRLAAARKSKTP